VWNGLCQNKHIVRVLVVEDDKKVASFIRRGLTEEAYAVDVSHDGETGAHQAENFEYDAVILDLMLSGEDVLRRIRAQRPGLPVLLLTAKGAVEDRVAGLNLGADDYLVKPFAFAELSARLRALLRRGARESTRLQLDGLTLDLTTRSVTRDGRKIELSSKEFALLEYLMRNARRPVTRTMIVEHVWDLHFDSLTNVVDVYINYLRNKIDKNAPVPLIRTVRGVGYVLTDERS
jgi:DNA-binding response OmpR family regulator